LYLGATGPHKGLVVERNGVWRVVLMQITSGACALAQFHPKKGSHLRQDARWKNKIRHCVRHGCLAQHRPRVVASVVRLKSGRANDAGLLVLQANDKKAATTFVAALTKHRHP
jgi:hypothetical protein